MTFSGSTDKASMKALDHTLKTDNHSKLELPWRNNNMLSIFVFQKGIIIHEVVVFNLDMHFCSRIVELFMTREFQEYITNIYLYVLWNYFLYHQWQIIQFGPVVYTIAYQYNCFSLDLYSKYYKQFWIFFALSKKINPKSLGTKGF